jgi:hypothetical protein
VRSEGLKATRLLPQKEKMMRLRKFHREIIKDHEGLEAKEERAEKLEANSLLILKMKMKNQVERVANASLSKKITFQVNQVGQLVSIVAQEVNLIKRLSKSPPKLSPLLLVELFMKQSSKSTLPTRPLKTT